MQQQPFANCYGWYFKLSPSTITNPALEELTRWLNILQCRNLFYIICSDKETTLDAYGEM
jgi:hypothetical protein